MYTLILAPGWRAGESRESGVGRWEAYGISWWPGRFTKAALEIGVSYGCIHDTTWNGMHTMARATTSSGVPSASWGKGVDDSAGCEGMSLGLVVVLAIGRGWQVDGFRDSPLVFLRWILPNILFMLSPFMDFMAVTKFGEILENNSNQSYYWEKATWGTVVLIKFVLR